jgi:hypothetical protein
MTDVSAAVLKMFEIVTAVVAVVVLAVVIVEVYVD